MADIKWGTPPQPDHGPGSTRFLAEAAALRERPGEWALISGSEGIKYPSNIPGYAAFKGGGFEFTSRRRGDGMADVYARFVGEVAS